MAQLPELLYHQRYSRDDGQEETEFMKYNLGKNIGFYILDILDMFCVFNISDLMTPNI